MLGARSRATGVRNRDVLHPEACPVGTGVWGHFVVRQPDHRTGPSHLLPEWSLSPGGFEGRVRWFRHRGQQGRRSRFHGAA